jgi:ABC-2 type transport system ATP-binding protein
VWERISDVREATGMTVLVTTHYMDEADQYCGHLALMHQGRIRATGTPESLKHDLAEVWRGAGRDVGPDAGQYAEPTLEDVFRHFAGSCGTTGPSSTPAPCSRPCGC